MRPVYRLSIFPHRHRQHEHKATKKEKKKTTNTPKQANLTQTNDYAKQTKKHKRQSGNRFYILYYILFFIFVIQNETVVTSFTAFMFIVCCNSVFNCVIKLYCN